MHKNKEVYPVEVHDLALESWLNNSTILEPDKHKRPHSAAKDGNDTTSAHLQIDTDEEAYSKFKDNYEASVKAIMRERSDKIKLKYSNDTPYNRKVIERLERQADWFPGKSWFLGKKPKETKTNYDHTTGLCKDCHAPQVNYRTLLQKARDVCHCGTQNCPTWVCTCDEDEECSCPNVCQCDSCLSCQVISCDNILECGSIIQSFSKSYCEPL